MYVYMCVVHVYGIMLEDIPRITIIIIREKRLRHDSRTINVISSIDWEYKNPLKLFKQNRLALVSWFINRMYIHFYK